MNFTTTLYALLLRLRNLARFAIKVAVVVFGAQTLLTLAAAAGANSALANVQVYGMPALRLVAALVLLHLVTRGFDAALYRVAAAHRRPR